MEDILKNIDDLKVGDNDKSNCILFYRALTNDPRCNNCYRPNRDRDIVGDDKNIIYSNIKQLSITKYAMTVMLFNITSALETTNLTYINDTEDYMIECLKHCLKYSSDNINKMGSFFSYYSKKINSEYTSQLETIFTPIKDSLTNNITDDDLSRYATCVWEVLKTTVTSATNIEILLSNMGYKSRHANSNTKTDCKNHGYIPYKPAFGLYKDCNEIPIDKAYCNVGNMEMDINAETINILMQRCRYLVYLANTPNLYTDLCMALLYIIYLIIMSDILEQDITDENKMKRSSLSDVIEVGVESILTVWILQNYQYNYCDIITNKIMDKRNRKGKKINIKSDFPLNRTDNISDLYKHVCLNIDRTQLVEIDKSKSVRVLYATTILSNYIDEDTAKRTSALPVNISIQCIILKRFNNYLLEDNNRLNRLIVNFNLTNLIINVIKTFKTKTSKLNMEKLQIDILNCFNNISFDMTLALTNEMTNVKHILHNCLQDNVFTDVIDILKNT